jgi:hypothetical protein
MKLNLISLLLFLLCINYVSAQKVNLKRWVKHTVDSLQKDHVDTILYYHEYCSECDVKSKVHHCEIEDVGYEQIENIIIYQKNERFYSLTFDCNYPSIKNELISCKSIPYFISVVPVLNARDRAIKGIYKQHKFLPPIPSDGVYTGATIYCNKVTQGIYMSNEQKTDPDSYKAWGQYFWFDKQVKLFELINADLLSK